MVPFFSEPSVQTYAGFPVFSTLHFFIKDPVLPKTPLKPCLFFSGYPVSCYMDFSPEHGYG